jgi:DNA transformation protein
MGLLGGRFAGKIRASNWFLHGTGIGIRITLLLQRRTFEASPVTYHIKSYYDVSGGIEGQVKEYFMSNHDNDFLEFVLDQLGHLRGVRSRRMFGAYGLYQKDDFFAIVADGKLYFRTGDQNRSDYEQHGMEPFEYAPGKLLKNYYEVPVDILEDDGELRNWAQKAVRAQVDHKASKTSGKRRRKKD